MSPRTSTILVASDVHGRIPMLLRVALEFQREFGQVDAILVSGDLGVWPTDANLDTSTAKMARSVPEELGFRAFAPLFPSDDPPRRDTEEHLQKARTTLTRVLGELTAPLFFVGGNHEDYPFLEKCRARSTTVPVPVDGDGRLLWIPHGAVVPVPTAQGPVRVAGLGGIAAHEGGRNPDKYHPLALVDEDAALSLMDPGTGGYDILVTHDSARDFVHEGYGSSAIAAMVSEVQPSLHLCGHYHSRVDPKHYENGAGPGTLGVHINTFMPDREDGRLRPNCLGVVSVEEGRSVRFSFAEESFLRRFSARNWYKV